MPPKKTKKAKAKASEEELNSALLSQASPLLRFVYSSHVKLDEKVVWYDVKFNWLLKPGEPLVFATAGVSQVRVYECEDDGQLKFLTAFQDPTDSFFACAWSCDSKFRPLLAAAGLNGVIRIFDLASCSVCKDFVGHTHSVNDLKFHSRDTNLLFSASKDHSIRLWNIQTDVMVAVFHGEIGHRDEAISIDVDPTGMRLITAGMDHAIKVWKLDDCQVESAMKLSYNQALKPFPTLRQQFPDFTSRNVHGNYVDCVRWFGDLIISKACSVDEDENDIVIWKAGKPSQKWSDITLSSKETYPQTITSLKIEKCRCWFMRFALNSLNQVLALGNEVGQTYLYNLTASNPKKIQKFVLNHLKCTKAIRQTAFSRDGSILICVCEDGTIWRWDRTA